MLIVVIILYNLVLIFPSFYVNVAKKNCSLSDPILRYRWI